VLYETLNIIDINIASTNSYAIRGTDGAAIQGIENADGTEAYIVPGRNYPDQWASNGDSSSVHPPMQLRIA
jgi:hypothetical protein